MESIEQIRQWVNNNDDYIIADKIFTLKSEINRLKEDQYNIIKSLKVILNSDKIGFNLSGYIDQIESQNKQ